MCCSLMYALVHGIIWFFFDLTVWKVLNCSVHLTPDTENYAILCRKPSLSLSNHDGLGEWVWPFQTGSYQKLAKKPWTDWEEPLEVEHQFETSIHIIYKKPAKCSTQVHAAVNVNELITTMTKHDPVLWVLSFDCKPAFHPTNDKYPPNEEEFKNYFLIHEPSTHPVLKKQVTIGCIICTLKSNQRHQVCQAGEPCFNQWAQRMKDLHWGGCLRIWSNENCGFSS